MASQIKIKRSSVAGKVPTTSDIATGELAINTKDKKIYSSNGTFVFGFTDNYLQVANANQRYATKAYAASNSYVKLILANTNSYIADVYAAIGSGGSGGAGFSSEAVDYGYITSAIDPDLNRDYGTL